MHTEGRKVLSPHGAARKCYTDGTVQLDTSILMSKAENKYAELIESTNSPAAARRRKTTLVVLQTELEVLKAFYTKFQNGDEGKPPRKEGGRPSGDSYPTKWTSVPPRKGNRSPRRLVERIITGASETMLTSPSGFVMNLPSAVDLTIRRKERRCQACLRIEERICDQRRQERQVVLRHARDSRLPRMKTIDGHA
jgi:hypothetical protein